jgi:purine-binding chemotaxis protein CheW
MNRAELLRRPTLEARPAPRAPASSEQFFTVLIGRERFGLPIGSVRTVFRAQAIVPAPLAPPWVRGLINLRGHIVTAISLNVRLGMDSPEAASQANPLAVGVEIEGDTFALIVDGVGDVAEISADDSIGRPAGMAPMARRMTTCVYITPAGILPIIDLHAAVSPSLESEHEIEAVS